MTDTKLAAKPISQNAAGYALVHVEKARTALNSAAHGWEGIWHDSVIRELENAIAFIAKDKSP